MGEFAHTIGIRRGIVGVAEAELAPSSHIAEFVDGPGIRARTAKRSEICDNGIGLDHHGFVAAEYLQGGILGCGIDGIVQRIQSDQAMMPYAVRYRRRRAGKRRGRPGKSSFPIARILRTIEGLATAISEQSGKTGLAKR